MGRARNPETAAFILPRAFPSMKRAPGCRELNGNNEIELVARVGSYLREVEAVELHHFDPSCNEVLDEFHPRVIAGIHFCDGPQL